MGKKKFPTLPQIGFLSVSFPVSELEQEKGTFTPNFKHRMLATSLFVGASQAFSLTLPSLNKQDKLVNRTGKLKIQEPYGQDLEACLNTYDHVTNGQRLRFAYNQNSCFLDIYPVGNDLCYANIRIPGGPGITVPAGNYSCSEGRFDDESDGGKNNNGKSLTLRYYDAYEGSQKVLVFWPKREDRIKFYMAYPGAGKIAQWEFDIDER